MKKISFIAALILFNISCEKKLNLVNPNSPTTNGYWVTEKQAFDGSTAMYSGLTVDGTYMRSFPGLSDSRGDDFVGDSPWADLVLTGKFIIPSTSGPVQWIWRDFYIVINRANQVIEGVGKMDPAVLSQEKKNRILGQAYFLRAFSYFNLANTFKILPVITSSEFDRNTSNYPATATEDALWNQIFTDLQAAETNLPINYDGVDGPDKGQKGRATKGSAAGLLGKAYLYRKDWTKAAAQFEKFFSGPLKNVYSLMPDYRDNFKDVNENNAESLFEIQFTSGGSTDNWCCEPNSSWRQWTSVSITYAMDGKGFSDYLPTRWIYNEFKLEKTTTAKSDPRLLATIASYEPADNSITAYGGPWTNPITNIYPRKYTNDGLGPAFEAFGGSFINNRILRYADILLMHAEALNELNKTSEAYPFIQQVRTRALLPNLATVKPNMTQVQMRDQIAHERALEFSIEGQRINDIIRWGWLYNPTKLAELKTHDTDFDSWTPGNEYLPIPQTELDLNKNLLPNPAN
ncbi:MAG: RagB/SusD family nutrient uptake outer membrane protein [Ferruginibacter sp.]